MKRFNTRKYPLSAQYIISLGLVLMLTFACYLLSNLVSYRMVALLLLMVVSVIAMLFEILPVLTAAILSAIIWNFFFIPPLFTFHIGSTEDVLMFLLYFLIALVNAVLTFKIREEEQKARDKEEKENTIKLYNTLLNSLTHELRTPIATIIGAVDTLKENRKKLSVETQAELLNEIDYAGLRLNRQVENLLSMSRLESGMLKPKMDWCDINELTNSVIQKMDSEDQMRIINISKDDLPYFQMDAGLIEQVLHNLLHNALQYTPKNSTITIESTHRANLFVLAVSDNGPGFPDSEIEFVFDKFYRLPNTKPGGSGLGLSISKGFVEAMGGTIKLENNFGGGAKFTVEIPAETTYINRLKNE